MSAGEDPWSGPGGLEAVATMLRNVVAAEAGEDPWSGPGKKESNMGRSKAAEAGEDPWSGPGEKESDMRPISRASSRRRAPRETRGRWSGTGCIKAAMYKVTIHSTLDQASKRTERTEV